MPDAPMLSSTLNRAGGHNDQNYLASNRTAELGWLLHFGELTHRTGRTRTIYGSRAGGPNWVVPTA